MPQRKNDPVLNPQIKDQNQIAKEEAYKDIKTIYNGFVEAAKRGQLDSLVGPNADYLKLVPRGKLNSLWQMLNMPGAAEENAQTSLSMLKQMSGKPEYDNLPSYKRETWEALTRLRNNQLLQLAATTFTDRTVEMIKPLVTNLMSNPKQSLAKALRAKMSMDVDARYRSKYAKLLYPEDIRSMEDDIVLSPAAAKHADFLADWLTSGGGKLYKDADLNPLTITEQDKADPTKWNESGKAAIQNALYGRWQKYKNPEIPGRMPCMTPGGFPVADPSAGDTFDPLHGLTSDDVGADYIWSNPSLKADDELKKYVDYRIKLQKGVKRALYAR